MDKIQFQHQTIKNFVWIFLNLPALSMLILLFYQPHFRKVFTSYSGYIALILLVVELSLNPLSIIFPKFTLVKKVNRFRRPLGVAIFSYVVLHFFCFFIKRGYSFAKMLPYLFHPAIFSGAIALLILALLALTSNNYSIKKLTFPRWKFLHRSLYIAEGLIFVHMLFVGAIFYAFLAFVPLVTLQVLRMKATKV